MMLFSMSLSSLSVGVILASEALRFAKPIDCETPRITRDQLHGSRQTCRRSSIFTKIHEDLVDAGAECASLATVHLFIRCDPKLDHVRLLGHFSIGLLCDRILLVYVPIDTLHFAMTGDIGHGLDERTASTASS